MGKTKYNKNLKNEWFEVKYIREIEQCQNKSCIKKAVFKIFFDFRKEPIKLCVHCARYLAKITPRDKKQTKQIKLDEV